MTDDQSHVWSSVELYDAYRSSDCKHESDLMSKKHLLIKLKEYFGDDLIELKINGCASLYCFSMFLPYKVSELINDDEDEDEDIMVTKLAKKIVAETDAITTSVDYDVREYSTSNMIQNTSKTLLSLISILVSKKEVNRKSLSLTQSIQQHITNKLTPIPLCIAVKLHHRFGSKEVIEVLCEHGYVSSYDEVLRFRASAAKYVSTLDMIGTELRPDGPEIQSWIDNYDLQVFTPNGNRETHALAIELTQQGRVHDEEQTMCIPRLSKKEWKTQNAGLIPKSKHCGTPSKNSGIRPQNCTYRYTMVVT